MVRVKLIQKCINGHTMELDAMQVLAFSLKRTYSKLHTEPEKVRIAFFSFLHHSYRVFGLNIFSKLGERDKR